MSKNNSNTIKILALLFVLVFLIGLEINLYYPKLKENLIGLSMYYLNPKLWIEPQGSEQNIRPEVVDYNDASIIQSALDNNNVSLCDKIQDTMLKVSCKEQFDIAQS